VPRVIVHHGTRHLNKSWSIAETQLGADDRERDEGQPAQDRGLGRESNPSFAS